MTKPSFSTILSFGIIPLVTATLIIGYVWMLRSEEHQGLLNQFNQEVAPLNNTILNDDAILLSYIKTYGPAPTMKVIIAAADSARIDCHNRAHQFGRMSFEQFGEEVMKLNLPECHSGFYHGAIEAYFKKNGTDHLADKLSVICPENLNTFFMHQCRHGIGHGLMAWSSYDLPATLDYCNLIQEDNGKASCRTGAFMENIVGSLTDSPEARAAGHFTKYLSTDPQYPCNIVKDEYKGDCYFLQTDRMYTLSKNGFQGVVDGCMNAPEEKRYICFASMGRTVGGVDRGRPEQAVKDCQLIPGHSDRVECIKAVAKDYLWDPSGQEGGLRFCSLVSREDGFLECFKALTEHAKAVLDSPQRASFCSKVPQEIFEECSSSPS